MANLRKSKGKVKLCPVTKKVMLRTETDAKMALAFGAGLKGSIRYYPCKFCNAFHTTSQPYKKKVTLNANADPNSTTHD